MTREGYQLVPGWGRCPAHWSVRRIRDVLIPSKDGFIVNDNVEYTQVTVRIRHRGIVPRGKEVGVRIKTKNQNQIRSGQFLISKIDARNGACGIVPLELEGAITTHDFLAYDVNSELAMPGFWDILSGTSQFVELCKLASEGTTNRVRLRPDEFMALPVPLPPLSGQHRIVAALRVMDAAIAASEEVLERTRAFKKALAHELLTRGLPGRHKRFRDSPLGKIPAEWEVKRLGEVAEIQTGMAKNKKRHAHGITEVPYLRVANVQDGFVDLTELKTIRVQPSDLKRHGLQAGDVLMTEGGDSDKLGRGCVWEAPVSPCIHQNHVFAVRCGEALQPHFLALHAASPRGRRYFLDASKQTTNLASINATQLRALPVPLPSEGEQDAIVELVAGVTETEDSRVMWANELVKQRDLARDALLAGALGGAA